MDRAIDAAQSFGDQGWGDEIAWGVLITVTLALASLPFGLVHRLS
jgi:polar amino acid transport system permease protein